MNPETSKIVFQVVFRGSVVGTYSTRKRARTAADKKDLQHGSYAHSVREVDAVSLIPV